MNQHPGIFGRKLGCVQLFTEQGDVQRTTVIEAAGLTVLGKRTKERDGYVALVFGLEDRKTKHTKKAVAGQYQDSADKKSLYKDAKTTPKRVIKELRCDDAFAAKFEPGQVVKLSDVFEAGQMVDAQGITIGRGFTGVMRRWGFAGFPRTHGTHEYQRHGGSIGTNMTPGRTLPNIKMGGHYGDETVSILNLKIVRIDDEKGYLFIEGGVPGAKNGLVRVRHTVKKRKAQINNKK